MLIMTMKEVNVVIICLLLISVVRGEDATCEAGYAIGILTVGNPSHCSGISKITTEAECAAAAEYNRKNNIDKNDGYEGRVKASSYPPGCFYHKYVNNKYKWNDNTKSTRNCTKINKCICKAKTCIKCPINSYSEGGTNPTCIPCPKDTPYTGKGANIFDSVDVCAVDKNTLYCKAGTSYSGNTQLDTVPIRASGTCISNITTEEECKLAAEYNSKNNIDKNYGYRRQLRQSDRPNRPPGCFRSEGEDDRRRRRRTLWRGSKSRGSKSDYMYYWNPNTKSTKQCSDKYNCICKPKELCLSCPRNTYSAGGAGEKAECKKCVAPFITDKQRTKCYNPEIEKELAKFKKELVAQKEKQNDLSIKNSRLWQKEQIRLQHDKLMQQRKSNDDKKEQESCELQRNRGTVIFPALEISNEIEDVEDTTCIDTNRDELLKSFCGFRMDLDKLFGIQQINQQINEKAKMFWPNICCKERKDKTLEVCEDPTGNIKREDIIPFALSQGGDYSRHNLYVEVTDTIKHEGYLHKGMMKLLDSLSSVSRSKKENARKLINTFFNEVSLCGPRIVDAPGAKDKKKLCELFIPYQHAMTQFYNLIEKLYTQPLTIQTSSFLETMEKSLRKRSAVKRIGKTNDMQQVMQAKPAKTPKAEQQCKHTDSGSTWTSKNLATMKQTYCTGYNHLDLSSTEIKNIAIHYLKNDIAYDDKKMFSLKQSLRYEVTDNSCPAAPLFTAKDISIQQVAMDVLGNELEWVAVVNLNTKAENGYLQSELPYCEVKEYLIGAKVTVKAFVDNDSCCYGWKDFNKCKDKPICKDKLKPLKDERHEQYSKDVALTGTQYTVTNSHESRRRRLLQQGNARC